jgi:hypothetical protein
MVLVSCGPMTSGNLVAPPMVELCVTVEPSTATVSVDGSPLDETLCRGVYEGSHDLTAEAKGYVPYSAVVEVYADTVEDIVMTKK